LKRALRESFSFPQLTRLSSTDVPGKPETRLVTESPFALH
jgi:hypothetical protein